MSTLQNYLGDRRPLLAPVNGLCPNCGAKAINGALLCGCRVGGRLHAAAPAGENALTPVAAIAQPAIAWNDHLTFREKQDYYIYDTRPYRMKHPPKLNPELVQALKNEKLDKLYRFVWGGVVIVRETENSDFFTIPRGDRNATHVVNGVVLPRYPFARAQQARGFYYTDALNHKVCVTREEFIPKEYTARVDYRYVDFGVLKWHLEQRTDAEQLIQSGVYDAKEQVPNDQWVCLLALETKNHRYYEPGLEMIEVLQKREWQNRNVDLRQVAALEMERMEKARLARAAKDEEAGDAEFDLLFDDVVRNVERNAAYALPIIPGRLALPPAMKTSKEHKRCPLMT